MAGLLRYALFRHDVSRIAVWSVTGGTEDAGYPASNLNGRDPTAPAKLTTTSGILQADLSAAAVALYGVQLVHTNLAPGLTVSLQASAASDFGSIAFSQAITIPALKNNWPVNPYALFASPQTYDYWRLNVSGTNPVALSLGHVSLLAGVQSFTWAKSELKWTDTIPVWDDVTEIDVPQDMDLLTQLRACEFDTVNDATAQEALDDWWFDARGQILPFTVIPNVTVNESYYMTFQEKTKEVTVDKSISVLRIKLKEFGRGMRPTPWLT
jgi:hypothetical protein